MALRDIIAFWEPSPRHNMSREERYRRFNNRPIATSNQPGNAGTTVPRPRPSQATGRTQRRAARATSTPATARPGAILRTIAKDKSPRLTSIYDDPTYRVAYTGRIPAPPKEDSPWSSTPSTHGERSQADIRFDEIQEAAAHA